MVKLTINGRVTEAKEGEMLLTTIKRMGIDVPALCHHDAVEPYGACRLCMVEITRKEWDGWVKHVTSCLYPVEDGLIVRTHTEEVDELRRQLLDLQLASCPNSLEVRKLAAEYGVTQTSYEPVPDGNDCILCGLCTRICDALGFHAISMVNRGHGREVAPPLKQAPPDCVGCLSCAENCPTHYIEYEDSGQTRTIWDKQFKRIECEKCGKLTITEAFADALSQRRDIPREYFNVCDECHRKEISLKMGSIVKWSRSDEEVAS